MYPIVFPHPARIDNMRQIVLRVRHNKIGMGNGIAAVSRF